MQGKHYWQILKGKAGTIKLTYFIIAPYVFPIKSINFAFSKKKSSLLADMAQLVEQRIRNAWVTSSSLVIGSSFFIHATTCCGISSVGRALASQAEGRGFESRIPLFCHLTRGLFMNTFLLQAD